MTPPGQAAPPDADPVPALPASAALVALVPATADLDRAASAAWAFARRVANAGRRVALIDCFVDAPRLHTVAGESNEDGIVDVFEYGASLSRIARAQPEGTLFFVPAGTFSPDPAGMMARPRWRRLSAGFRHEEAVMLLFLSPDCLGALASDVDGLVALAPDGPDAEVAAAPEIRAALARGIPLLATFGGAATAAADPEPAAERPAPPAPGDAATPPRTAAPARPRLVSPRDADPLELPDWPSPPPDLDSTPRRGRLGTVLLLLVLAAAAAAYSYRQQLGWGPAPAAAPPEEPAPRLTPAYRALVPHAVDSLPFAVLVASWTSARQARNDADTIAGRGFTPLIAAVSVQGAPWYRVYVGPVASRAAADSLLRAVRAAGLDGSRSAVAVEVPLSFALRRFASPLLARAASQRLRAAGVDAFVLGQADGSYRLFAGAFAQPDQAAFLDSLLTSTGSAGPLGPRVGFRP